MRKITAILLIACLAFACRYNTGQNQEVLKEHLKKTMNDFLYKGVNNDSSKVTFNVLDVTYFADEAYYECEFKVHMRQRNLDTIGIMAANISKDFKQVGRKY